MITIMPDPVKDLHDKAVRTLSDSTLAAAHNDLWNRKTLDRKNPEHRWILDRRAALTRELIRRNPAKS